MWAKATIKPGVVIRLCEGGAMSKTARIHRVISSPEQNNSKRKKRILKSLFSLKFNSSKKKKGKEVYLCWYSIWY
jgi:hypothetical protein